MLEKKTLPILEKALARMEQGFENLPASAEVHDTARIEAVLMHLAEKMQEVCSHETAAVSHQENHSQQ